MNEKLKRIAMNDDGFLFDPETGISYTTNAIGLEILRKMKETGNLDDLSDMLQNNFEVTREEAERDLIDFQELLKSKGLID